MAAEFFKGLRFSDKTADALYNLPHVGEAFEVSAAQNRRLAMKSRLDFNNAADQLRSEFLSYDKALELLGYAATKALCLNTAATRGVDEYIADFHRSLVDEKMEADYDGRPLSMQAVFTGAERRLQQRHAFCDDYDGLVLTEGYPGKAKNLLDATLTEAYTEDLAGLHSSVPELDRREMPQLERCYGTVNFD